MEEPVKKPNKIKRDVLNLLFLFDVDIENEFQNDRSQIFKKHQLGFKSVIEEVEKKILFTSLNITGTLSKQTFDLVFNSLLNTYTYHSIPYNEIPGKFPELSSPKKLSKSEEHQLDYVVTFWDGVDDGVVGGMGHLVRRWLNVGLSKGEEVIIKKKRYYIQALVPSPDNEFPIARYFSNNKELYCSFHHNQEPLVSLNIPVSKEVSVWKKMYDSLKSNSGWVIMALILLGVLLQVFLSNPIDETWAFAIVAPVVIYGICFWLWSVFDSARSLLLRFIFPILLAIFTLALGTIGFKEYSKVKKPFPADQEYEYSMSWSDSFFGAANLITLNASVFSEDSIQNEPNDALLVARTLGIILAIYAFVLAFSFAAGSENMDRLYFWWFRFRNGDADNLPFKVVLGNGQMAVKLALDFEKQKQKVVFFDNGENESIKDILKDRAIWYFTGRITLNQDLQKVYFWKAEEVYVMGDSDEENFRTTQELDEIFYDKKMNELGREQTYTVHLAAWEKIKPWIYKLLFGKAINIEGSKWYIHLRDRRKREMLSRFTNHAITSFSIEQNTARRNFYRYPIDRFQSGNYQKKGSTQLVLLGFNELAEELALTGLKIGHFDNGKTARVIVYYQKEDLLRVKQFKKKYPAVFKYADPFSVNKEKANQVQDYTFFEKNNFVIDFRPLPEGETDLCNPTFKLYTDINTNRITSIYTCLSSGIESVAILGSILPRLEWIKKGSGTGVQCDIQIFCHYNYPDEEEEKYIEAKLNSICPAMPIFFFGNHLSECAAKAIKAEKLDWLAKEIAFLYEVLFKYDDIELLNKQRENEPVKIPELVFNQDENLTAKVYFERYSTIKSNPYYKQFINTRWRLLSENHRESNRQAADHAIVKTRLGDLEAFTEKAKLSLDDFENKDKAAIKAFFANIKQENLPNFAEIEHRRWCAANLIDGFLPYEGIKEDWKSVLKSQKIHDKLIPFNVLVDSDKIKDISGVVAAYEFR